jgi:hypothetical protein
MTDQHAFARFWGDLLHGTWSERAMAFAFFALVWFGVVFMLTIVIYAYRWRDVVW